MADVQQDYLVLPDSERERLAIDRLRAVETNHYQLSIAKLAGDPVNEQELERLTQAMASLRSIVESAAASHRTPSD